MFTCVGWQVTLCDPLSQAMLRRSEMGLHKELYTLLAFTSVHVTNREYKCELHTQAWDALLIVPDVWDRFAC